MTSETDGCDWGWLEGRLARRLEESRRLREEARQEAGAAPVVQREGWGLEAGCWVCGTRLKPLAGGTSDGRETQVMARCHGCRSGYQIRCRMDRRPGTVKADRKAAA